MAPAGIAATIMSANAGRVRVNLSQPAADLLTVHGAGAKLYLDSATSEAGTYSNVSSTVLVSGTEQYESVDTAGTATTWYKARVGDSGATAYSDYSAAVQNTSLLAYATLDDLAEMMELPDESRYAYLSSLLVRGAEWIDARCHRKFYRDPQVSGDSTFYVDIERSGRSSLKLASGGGSTTSGIPLDLVSITTLKVRDSESDTTYTTIASGDQGYYLDAGDGIGEAGTDWPYGDVTLSSDGAAYTTYPVGKRGVEITGVLGFPKVPEGVRQANAEWARDRYGQAPGGQPSSDFMDVPDRPAFHIPAYVMLTSKSSKYVRRTWASS